jgi:putative ABC transport system substrate-binding protein
VISRLLPLLSGLFLAGCVGVKPWMLPTNEAADPEPVAAVPDRNQPEPAATAVTIPAPRRAPAVRPTPRVLVIRSSDADNYLNVSDTLMQNLAPDYELLAVSLTADQAGTADPVINVSEWTAAVAIGLDAAAYAAAELDLPIVFCQIFDYRQLLDAHAGLFGVAAMPPLALQLESWKAIAPNSASVGVIVTEDETDLIAEARVAADALGIELHTAFARTDRDALYQFKRFAQTVDALWLQPNSAILSPAVIQEILDYAFEHRVQTIVFNDVLLDWGALLSVGSHTEDVAAAVAASLGEIVNGNAAELMQVRPLSIVNAHVNEKLAAELGVLESTDAAREKPLLIARDDDT